MKAISAVRDDQRIRVLVIDYSRMGTQLILNALRLRTEFVPRATGYSPEALQNDMTLFQPDVVLISVDTKGIRGLTSQLLRICGDCERKIPTVVLLPLFDTEEGRELLQAGASTVLNCNHGLVDIYTALIAAHRNENIPVEWLVPTDTKSGLTTLIEDSGLSMFKHGAQTKQLNA